METSVKSPPQRQKTLGPSAPIHDWEVERATLKAECKESKETIKGLVEKIEEDRITYERNNSTLIREVKRREQILEKKLKDMEEQLMNQIFTLQRELDEKNYYHQEDIKSIKQQYEFTLEAEERKYHRRLLSVQKRQSAKEGQYPEIVTNDQMKSPDNSKEDSADKKSWMDDFVRLEIPNPEVQSMKDVTEERSGNWSGSDKTEGEIHTLKSALESMKTQYHSVKSELDDQHDEKKKQAEYITQCEVKIAELQSKCDKYKRRLGQSLTIRDEQLQEINEKFMLEARRADMTMQAQIQNLKSEHMEMLRELKEQHEQEKEMVLIEEKAKLDQLRRDLQYEKEEALKNQEKDWKDKNQDLYASMSQDALKIQAYWETKLGKAQEEQTTKLSRLQGEIEVIKDRLSKEITRRKEYQTRLTDIIKKNDTMETQLVHWSKRSLIIEKELNQLKTQYTQSHRLSLDLVSMSSPHNDVPPHSQCTLPELLRLSIKYISLMQITSHQMTYYDHDMIYV